MLDRVRRLVRGAAAGNAAERTTNAAGDEILAEGAYAGPGRTSHYVLEGGTTTACGRPPTGLHRWSSSWSHVDEDTRCKRCTALVGARANVRHGPPTFVDVAVFGVVPPDLPQEEQVAFRAQWERDAPNRRGDPPPPPGATFSDPPFLYAKDPFRRHGTLEPQTDRVINDVYTRRPHGKKWHRVYDTHGPSELPAIAPYGRSFAFPCGDVGHDFEPDGDGVFQPAPRRADTPEPAEMCKACVQSDAKHGKLGDLPTNRWDR